MGRMDRYTTSSLYPSIHSLTPLELDNQFPRFHAEKARRIKERGSKCCITMPQAKEAAIELLEEL